MRFPLFSKAAALAAVIMALMWALWSVQSIVQERQQRQSEARQSVANSLAGSQTLLGPVLLRSCTETWVIGQFGENEKRPVSDSQTKLVRLPAASLKMDAQVDLSPRHRGIFQVNGYDMSALITAQWADAAQLGIRPERAGGRVSCDKPILSVALSDARGIRVAEISVNGRPVQVLPGSGMEGQSRGFKALLDESDWPASGPVSVVLKLDLAGTQALSMVPVADTNLIKLDANWPHPSFGGRFLPSERHLHERKFDATWKVSSLASSAQQEWLKGSPLCTPMSTGEQLSYVRSATGDVTQTSCIESFGVDFMDPVNPYTLSDRATKYGLLFIVLTFVAVGLVEVLRQLRVHPIQYLLVGAALSVFFLLLVSLSEHMVFELAYAAAALSCTALLTFYGGFVLGGWLAGLGFGAGIGGLFGVLYTLLQMEQRALVLGSVLLFIVLAIVMVSTRKLDWYALSARLRSDDGTRPQTNLSVS